MSIVPTWPIAAICLAVGVAGGAVSTRYVYVNKIEKIQAQHTELLRQREVKRADDERAARAKEQGWVERVNEAEQRRINETDRIRNDADSLIARLRKQAASKPASTSCMPQATAAGESTAGGELSNGSREGTVRLAQRAEEQREALGACYRAYDATSN
jgi:hypothetical protein